MSTTSKPSKKSSKAFLIFGIAFFVPLLFLAAVAVWAIFDDRSTNAAFADFAAVCDGVGNPKARAFDKASSHDLVVFEKNDSWGVWATEKPADPSRVDVVVCIDKFEKHTIDECDARSDRTNSVARAPRIRQSVLVNVVVARSGESLGKGRVLADAPKRCQDFEKAKREEFERMFHGPRPDFAGIRSWVNVLIRTGQPMQERIAE